MPNFDLASAALIFYSIYTPVFASGVLICVFRMVRVPVSMKFFYMF